MRLPFRWTAFLCFILSGAASVSYQTMWLRSAMTYFGVVTPISSAVLSVFMMGLAIGTYVTGRLSQTLSVRSALISYGVIEGAIAALAFAVPRLFQQGYLLLLNSGTEQSATYLLYSCLIITAILLPVCTLIGATFPLLMKCLAHGGQAIRPFSLLYNANLLGALAGCIIPCIFIELYGFQGSLELTMVFNAVAAMLAFCGLYALPPDSPEGQHDISALPGRRIPPSAIAILLVFGFVTLGSEAVWLKAFTVTLYTTVYAFAAILAVYLIFTTLGTLAYRKNFGGLHFYHALIILLPACVILPLVFNSVYFIALIDKATVLSIAPFCFCLGYLTPKIIDEVCGNETRAMSVAYTYNCIGCIAGPVFTTYLLFPVAGIKFSLIAYACVLFPVALFLLPFGRMRRLAMVMVSLVVLVTSLNFRDFEEYIEENGTLTRDHIGYIGAYGKGMSRYLSVNGVAMTVLTNMTKNMAHLPMLEHPEAKSALVICFGMGTTVRSLTSWPLDSITAVELSKGVVSVFGYFFSDADRVLADPRVHIVNDDGRRFLSRSHEHYDLIVIDPPPPQPAAGSGLLYTDEFLSLVKSHLSKDGILQHWIPYAQDLVFTNAVLNAVHKNFKYVRLYHPPRGMALYISASDSPIPDLSVPKELSVMPASAAKDFMEWNGNDSLAHDLEFELQPVHENNLLIPDFSKIYMSDDRLYNEFYFLRTVGLITSFKN